MSGCTIAAIKSAPATMKDVWAAAAAHGDREFLVYEGEREGPQAVFDVQDLFAEARGPEECT